MLEFDLVRFRCVTSMGMRKYARTERRALANGNSRPIGSYGTVTMMWQRR